MAILRIRVELQRPDKGVEMDKLAQLGGETQKLLQLLAEDVGADAREGFWVAQDFYNQGVGFDAVYELADLDVHQVRDFNRAIDAVLSAQPMNNWAVPGIRPATIVQAARVAKLADIGETVRLGTYADDSEVVQWKPLRKEIAVSVLDFFNAIVEYRGMLQGVIHALYKESTPPYFQLRDFASRELVKCHYQARDYAQVYRALERRDAVVMVAGWIRARRLDRSICDLKVEKIQSTAPLNEEQLRQFFGSAPGWTGDLSTDQFIDSVRAEDGDE